MKKVFLVFTLCCALLVFGCGKDGSDDGNEGGKPINPPTGTDQLVVNGDFELPVNIDKTTESVVGEWRYIGGWNSEAATIKYEQSRGVNGSKCMVIVASKNETDVAITQKIKGLDPNKAYKATARIKTEGVSSGYGAGLSLEYLWAPTSVGVTGTSDWTTATLEIDNVPASGEITLCLRLGNTSSSSSGVAYFDNVFLSENTSLYTKESEHVKLVINKSELSISDAQVGTWLSNLDKIYDSYKELLGHVPFEGRKNSIRSKQIDAWAYAGEPIQWNKDYVSSELLSVANDGNWSFGIMHEIGHNYASYIAGGNESWNWNEELFANFRMYYGLSQTNGTVVMSFNELVDGKYQNVKYKYVGTQIKDMYKSKTDGGYDKTLGAGKPSSGDAEMYTLVRIQEKYGWQLFKDTFKELYELPRNTAQEQMWTAWQRFNYFMGFLSKHAGEDVLTTYTARELQLIEESLNKPK